MRPFLCGLLLGLAPVQACADLPAFGERPEVRAWIDEVAARHDLEAESVRQLIAGAKHQEEVLQHVRAPAESLPWHRYRGILLTAERTRAGRAWMQEHAAILADAQKRYGVPPGIIAAIVGIESSYGANTGRYRVLDSLLTLGFDYPPRSGFFLRQLESLLLLEAEHGIDPSSVRGSWAGAMGQGQFIPSSYRDFAVDGDGDGRTDLWDSPTDIIHSISNYLHRHNWRAGDPVARRIEAVPQALVSGGLEPDIRPDQLRAAGIVADPAPAEPVSVHSFDAGDDTEYWLCHHNFYVITRYNHSALYALAVHLLAQELVRAHG